MDTTTSIILSALTSSPVEDINVTVTNSTLLTTSVSGEASDGLFGWGWFMESILIVLLVMVLAVCTIPGAISCLVKKCRRTDPEDDKDDGEEEKEGNVEEEVAGHLHNDSSSTKNQVKSTVIFIDDINNDDDENNSMVISRSSNSSGSSIKKLTGGVAKLLSRVWKRVTGLCGGLLQRRELLPTVSSLLFNLGGRGSSGGGQWLAVQPADCGCGPLCRGGDGHCPVYRLLTVPLMIQQQAV